MESLSCVGNSHTHTYYKPPSCAFWEVSEEILTKVENDVKVTEIAQSFPKPLTSTLASY